MPPSAMAHQTAEELELLMAMRRDSNTKRPVKARATSLAASALSPVSFRKTPGAGPAVAGGPKAKQGKKLAKKLKIARPMNSFMVFAKEYRKMLREKYPNTDNKEISKMLGQKWKGLTPPQKSKYADQARLLAEQHKKDHPEWKFVRAPPRKGKGKAGKAGLGPTTGAVTVGTSETDDGHITAARAKPKPSHAKRTHHSTPAPLKIKQGAQTGPPLSPTAVSATSPQAMEQLHRLQCMQSQLLIQQQEIQASVEEKPPPSYVAPPGPYDGASVIRPHPSHPSHPSYQQQFRGDVAYAQSMEFMDGPPPTYEQHSVLHT